MGEYITPYRLFLHRINHLNFQNPYYDDFNGKITCRVINQDKFYFYLFLSRLNIPTPKVYEGNDRWEITLIQAVHGGMGYLMKF